MKTAIYLRKSRADEQNSDDTLTAHKDTLMTFAANNDLIVVKTYEEIVSGESLFARPQMLQLLQDIENNLYDAVLCMDIDRLGRGDMQEQGLIMNTFRNSDTRIITPREVYNPQNEKDEMFFEFKGIIARNELKAIKRRMLEGTKRTIAAGGYVSEPPYGYQRIYKNKIPSLEPHPEQSEHVKMIFDMYVNQGVGSHIIADTLNSMGLKTRRGTEFARNSVRFMLQNNTYIGKVQWNRNKHIRKNGTHKRKIVPEEEWIVSDGLHKAIIDFETFEKAQQIRATRSHPPSNTGEIKNPLAGLVTCAVCGKKMVRQNYKKKYNRPRLICNTKGCVRSVLLSHAEKRTYEEIEKFVRECENTMPPKPIDKTAGTRAILQGLERQMKTLLVQKEKLHVLLEQGVYDIETFMNRKKAVQGEIEAMESKITEQNTLLKAESGIKSKMDLLPYAKQALATYWDLPVSEQNKLLKQFIKTLRYEKTKTELNDEFFLQASYLYE